MEMTKHELIEKVIFQLVEDYHSKHDRAEAVKLIENIPQEKLEEYMEGVKFNAPKIKTFSTV